MKKRLLFCTLLALLPAVLCACGPAGTPAPKDDGPIEMLEEYVGTWVNMAGESQNIDPDTEQPITTITIRSDGALCFNGKELPAESVYVIPDGTYYYYYDGEKYTVEGGMNEDLDQYALTLTVNGRGYGWWVRSEGVEASVPAELVGTWSWVDPENGAAGGRVCPDEDGAEIRSFTVDADGTLTVNGRAYPLNVTETWFDSVNGGGSGKPERYFWGEKDASNWAPYSMSRNEMYSTEESLGLVTSPWAFSVHNDHCEDVVETSVSYLRGAE